MPGSFPSFFHVFRPFTIQLLHDLHADVSHKYWWFWQSMAKTTHPTVHFLQWDQLPERSQFRKQPEKARCRLLQPRMDQVAVMDNTVKKHILDNSDIIWKTGTKNNYFHFMPGAKKRLLESERCRVKPTGLMSAGWKPELSTSLGHRMETSMNVGESLQTWTQRAHRVGHTWPNRSAPWMCRLIAGNSWEWDGL